MNFELRGLSWVTTLYHVGSFSQSLLHLRQRPGPRVMKLELLAIGWPSRDDGDEWLFEDSSRQFSQVMVFKQLLPTELDPIELGLVFLGLRR